MKHKPVIIRIDDLHARISSDCDNFDVLCAMGVDTPCPVAADDAAWDAYYAARGAYAVEHAAEYAVVTWPEHVSAQRYNSDADYTGPLTLEEAKQIEPGAAIYGEVQS